MYNVPDYFRTYNPITELHTDSSDFDGTNSSIFTHMKTRRKRSTKILYPRRNKDFQNCNSESHPVTELSSKETWASVTTSISQNGQTIGIQVQKSYKNKKYKYVEGGDQSSTIKPKHSVLRHKVIPCLSNMFGRSSNNVKQMSIIKENPTENFNIDNGCNGYVNREHNLRKFNRRQQCYAAQPVYAVEGNIHAKTTPFQHTKIVREPLTTCKAVGNGNSDIYSLTSSSDEMETHRYFKKKKGKRHKPKHIVESGIGKDYFEHYEGNALNHIQQQCPSNMNPIPPYFIYPTPDQYQYQNTGCSPIGSNLNRSGFELGAACSGFWEYIVNKINTKLQSPLKRPEEATTNTSVFKTCACDEHKVLTTFDYVCPKCENQSIWCPSVPPQTAPIQKESCSCYRSSCGKMHGKSIKNKNVQCMCYPKTESQICCQKYSGPASGLPPGPGLNESPPGSPPGSPPITQHPSPPGIQPGSPRRMRLGLQKAPARLRRKSPTRQQCPEKQQPPAPCPQKQQPPLPCPQKPGMPCSPTQPSPPLTPPGQQYGGPPQQPYGAPCPPEPYGYPSPPGSPSGPGAPTLIPPPPALPILPPSDEPRPCQLDHDDVTGALSKQYNGQILCIHNPPCVLINGCLNLPGSSKEPAATDLYSVTTNERTNKFGYPSPNTKWWKKQQSAQYCYPANELQQCQIIRDASCQCFPLTKDMMSGVNKTKNESCQYHIPHMLRQLVTPTSGIHFHSSPIDTRKQRASDNDSCPESNDDIKNQATDIDFKYWLSPEEIKRQQNVSPESFQYRPSPTEISKQAFPYKASHERHPQVQVKRSKDKRPKHEKNIQSICSHNPPCEVVRTCCKTKLNPKLQNSCVHVPMCENVPLCLMELKNQCQNNLSNECPHKPKCTEVPICTRKYIVLTAKEEAATQVRPKAKMVCRHEPPCIMIPTCLARVCDSFVPFDAIPDCIHQPTCDMIPACCRKQAKEMVSFRSQYPKNSIFGRWRGR